MNCTVAVTSVFTFMPIHRCSEAQVVWFPISVAVCTITNQRFWGPCGPARYSVSVLMLEAGKILNSKEMNRCFVWLNEYYTSFSFEIERPPFNSSLSFHQRFFLLFFSILPRWNGYTKLDFVFYTYYTTAILAFNQANIYNVFLVANLDDVPSYHSYKLSNTETECIHASRDMSLIIPDSFFII